MVTSTHFDDETLHLLFWKILTLHSSLTYCCLYVCNWPLFLKSIHFLLSLDSSRWGSSGKIKQGSSKMLIVSNPLIYLHGRNYNSSLVLIIYLYITSRQCSGSSCWRLGTSCLFIILSHGIRKKGFTWASCARGNAFVTTRWVLRIFVFYTSIILFSKYFELFLVSKNAGSTIARVTSIALETKNLFFVEIM